MILPIITSGFFQQYRPTTDMGTPLRVDPDQNRPLPPGRSEFAQTVDDGDGVTHSAVTVTSGTAAFRARRNWPACPEGVAVVPALSLRVVPAS
jgi:hypothetical protein